MLTGVANQSETGFCCSSPRSGALPPAHGAHASSPYRCASHCASSTASLSCIIVLPLNGPSMPLPSHVSDPFQTSGADWRWYVPQ